MDNGAVTLNDEFLEPPQESYDEFTAIAGLGIVIIAPYWSDNDLRVDGTVNYAIYESSNPNPAATTKIAEIASIITNVTVATFNADWMLLVEWRGVRPFPAGSGSPAYIASVSLFFLQR